MPAVSKAQQQATAIAEHSPEKLNPENRGLLKMGKKALHEYASTPRKNLPERASRKSYRKSGR